MAKLWMFDGKVWHLIGGEGGGGSGGNAATVDLISDIYVDPSSPTTAIDSVSLEDGMSVLLAKQEKSPNGNYSQNGIYFYVSGTLQPNDTQLIGIGTTVTARLGNDWKGSSFTCFYIDTPPWTLVPPTETAWHPTENLTVVASLVKEPVVEVAQNNINLGYPPSGLSQTVNGKPVTFSQGDRVLLTGQDLVSGANRLQNNGIWTASDGTWLRAEDCSGIGDLVNGTKLVAASGLFKKTAWTCGFVEAGGPWRPGRNNKWYADTILSYAAQIDFVQGATPLHEASINHNLGTKDVAVQVYDFNTGETIYPKVDRFDKNSVHIIVLDESLDPGETLTARVMVTSTYDYA